MIKIEQMPTPNVSNTNYKMEGVVLHLTIGAFKGAVEWLRMSPEERLRRTGVKSWSSAHVVFDRNSGKIAQLAPFNKMSWHAGVIKKPSARARAVMKRDMFVYVNPNKYLIGFEFTGGYDIDRDGIIEGWEKLFTTRQIKDAVQVHLLAEKELGYELPVILTHKDISISKPNIEIPRMMYIAELNKQRALIKSPVAPKPVKPTDPVKPPIVEEVYEIRGKDISIKKK